jgi:hypothetical protein
MWPDNPVPDPADACWITIGQYDPITRQGHLELFTVTGLLEWAKARSVSVRLPFQLVPPTAGSTAWLLQVFWPGARMGHSYRAPLDLNSLGPSGSGGPDRPSQAGHSLWINGPIPDRPEPNTEFPDPPELPPPDQDRPTSEQVEQFTRQLRTRPELADPRLLGRPQPDPDQTQWEREWLPDTVFQPQRLELSDQDLQAFSELLADPYVPADPEVRPGSTPDDGDSG